eukprot:SAG22_NODE_9118_length_609_cov_1.080392_1_plen_174_part_01
MGLTLGRHLRQADKFAKPLEDTGTATVVGGVASVVTYLAALVYLIVYVVQQETTAYPTQATVSLFPGRDEMVEDGEVVRLPPTNCIAESGCWILRMNTPPGVEGIEGGTPRQCRYYAQGEALLDADRIVYTTADTVDTFHAIWRDENFGLSYDVDKVSEYSRELPVTTKKAAVD